MVGVRAHCASCLAALALQVPKLAVLLALLASSEKDETRRITAFACLCLPFIALHFPQ